MKIPRIIIAATNSGCGKTTITTGLLAALSKRGMKVQPFKVGPDYIDPMFHTFITGTASRNLDSWMLGDDVLSHIFLENSTGMDIAVVEGVMGLYDGYGGHSEIGSTAHVSRIIEAPVILVVNGEGMSLSIAALVHGFVNFNRGVRVKGVIINSIKSSGHYQLLKEIIEEHTGLDVLGYLPRMEGYSLESRHLGLVPSDEVEGLRDKVNMLAQQIEKTVDIELLLKIAKGAGDIYKPYVTPHFAISTKKEKARIAVAKDKAFSFYYKDNLELLETLGAQLVYFSPLEDSKLPEDINGLYMGGGYPEVFAKELQDNESMKDDIKKHIIKGLPAYAECGGLMYMSESISTGNGEVYEMVGLIPGKSKMTPSLQRFGYVELETLYGNTLSKPGQRIRGHEFHYSITKVHEDTPVCYKVAKRRKSGLSTWNCGYRVHNLIAGYPHLHFWANIEFARNFINKCVEYKNGGETL
jgi:cobyrinic acid a,c-diamide synthase